MFFKFENYLQRNHNIFEGMDPSKEEAKELQFRSFLMTILMKYIKREELTQKEAAKRLGVTQSRVSNLVHGKIDLFSSSMLLVMLERAGFKVYENIQTHAKELFAYHNVGRSGEGRHTENDYVPRCCRIYETAGTAFFADLGKRIFLCRSG